MKKTQAFVRTPVSVLHDKNLSDSAKLLYLEILGLSEAGKKGYCWATNRTLAESFGKTTRTITNLIAELETAGYITRQETKKDTEKKVLERKLYPKKFISAPPEENCHTPTKEISYTPCQKLPPPMEINFEENNNNRIEHRIEQYNKGVCYPQDFEILWEKYPRKLNKKGAFKAYLARLKEGAKSDELLRAVENYLRSIKEKGTAERFIMHASTFFGSEKRYEDYLEYHEEKLVTRCRIVAEDDDLPFG